MDDAEARAVLREHGQEPPKRGKLTGAWHARAGALRQDTPPPVPEEDTYDEGVTAGDFVSEAADPPPLPAERKPRKVRTARPSLRERVTGGGKGKTAKAKRRHPRVPVDRLITRGWEMMGGLAARVDVPLGRCLQMQAPVAGLIMEDITKGTFADRVLQPAARAEEKVEKGLALVGAPLCVVGLELAQRLPDDQRKLREAILWPMLVESMVLWDRIAGDKVEELATRTTREAPARERAEHLAQLIFAQPPDPAAAEPERETAGV